MSFFVPARNKDCKPSCRMHGWCTPLLLTFLLGVPRYADGVRWNPQNDPRWNNQNDPRWWWYQPNESLALLPTRGNSSHEAWSGTYWPNNRGGIAHRWTLGVDVPSFNYKLHSLSDLQNMSANDLKTLSPAEKYDIVNNRLDYPTVKSEWRRTSPEHPKWYGLCHGWAPASILYKEPNPVNIKAPNGISVPFGSSDVKALLTYNLGQVLIRSSW